ncbi:MAG TPA: 2-oxoacid:acceptor oxidoreductase subunit alpha [Candidatus Desulfofervidus auxilii]|uniref:2-oxoacid:acceptor oxidoreductase subunit alpha n=1 Tax=Desulfofervidus auxilii TaxID=1621989 RepID=A0A7C1W0Y5_DESA2|nr:2-oxoacid:acceptor oxidoreductase subunit alpha [Candidatus Desulfofervidus auxilii]
MAKDVLTGIHFLSGNYACVEGAIAAGCRFYAGYPITPSNEIAERMSFRIAQVGGIYIQMEDELGSMAALVGASWGGAKSMTATSGPGFSLMQENIGLAAMTETPCVVVNVQRGGPSTGLPTLVGQADVMQARWGSHGDYEIIALAPASSQECFDFTIKAFNLAERWRVPVIVLMDEVVGHMWERVIIPPKEEIKLISRKRPTIPPKDFLPFKAGKDLVPEMPIAGEGYRVHVTGLTHDEKGYPAMNDKAHNKLVTRLVDKIRKNASEIIEIEEIYTEDAEVILVSFGISARICRYILDQARKEGLKVGLLRFITVWPFPEERIRKLAEHIRAFVVVEINLGQIVFEVERAAGGQCDTFLIPHAGGHIHDPQKVWEKVKKFFK